MREKIVADAMSRLYRDGSASATIKGPLRNAIEESTLKRPWPKWKELDSETTRSGSDRTSR